jgi:ATP-dependent Clp protease protease subunit
MERIKHDTERDYFMSALESKEYGVVDEVFAQRVPATGK